MKKRNAWPELVMERRRGRGASYMCAGATGGLLPTPSEAGDCCLRGKEGGSIGWGKMEMQPTQEHWPLCHVTLRLPDTFTTTSVQNPCQIHKLLFVFCPCFHLWAQGRLGRPKSHLSLWVVDPFLGIILASGNRSRFVTNHGAANICWDVSGLPVMWPRNFMNFIPNLFLGQLISCWSDCRSFDRGGKGATFQRVDLH